MKFSFLKALGVQTQDLHSQPLASQTQANANTADEYVTFDLPMDMLLYGIDLICAKDTDSTLQDKIKEIEIKLDGSKVIHNLTGDMLKAISILNGKKPSTGFYNISIADPYLNCDPIYLKQYSSCKLKVTVAAGGTSVKNVITPTLQLGARQSYPRLSDLGASRLLVQTFLPQRAYGTNTGEQEYDHMRTQNVEGYLYELGDNGTLSNTAFSKLTLKLFSPNGVLTPIENVSIAQLREWSAQEANGNTLPTGLVYVPFPDKLKTSNFSNVKSYLNVASAGTNVQAKVLERYTLGGI